MNDARRFQGRLRPGDVVEVRPPAEIVATLDASGETDGLAFMPEMLGFVGKRLTVLKRVEKICDTIAAGGSRRMRDTVYLDDLRCDGTAHDGCQAECRLYWKEAWLARAEGASPLPASPDPAAMAELERIARANTRVPSDGADVFRCQATEALRASEPIGSVLSPGQYVREIASGNVGIGRFLVVAARAISWKLAKLVGQDILSRQARLHAARGRAQTAESGKLGLQPGDWVEVKSAAEIVATLNAKGRNKGMVFSSHEMLPACGRKYRVRRRVDRLIDEKSGRMLNIRNDCIVLEGFVCDGERSPGRWLCPRALYPYWREAWLRKVEPPDAKTGATA